MAGLVCKRCGSGGFVKNGVVRAHQRYRCRDCGFNFTSTPQRGKPAAMKAMAILLYGRGAMSFRAIGQCLGVSDVSVLRWVRAEAKALPAHGQDVEAAGPDGQAVMLDEMWHFLKKRPPSSGSGAPMIPAPGAPSLSNSANATTPPAKGSSTRSA